MRTHFDIADFEHELAALSSHPHLRHVAVVVPLAFGLRDMARAAIAEGPPFEPRDIGITFHQVLLTDREAIFVFGLESGAETLERILASEEFWATVGWWETVADGRPRLAETAYEWHPR